MGDRVYDSWWPWRLGTVVAILKTRLKLRWDDDRDYANTYDQPHSLYLRTA